MKSILMENNGLLMDKTDKWAKSIDPKYREVNPDTSRMYMRSDDLRWFGTLIDPMLRNVIVASAFESGAGFECHNSFKGRKNLDSPMFTQLEYFTTIIREAVLWRSGHEISSLNLHVNYHGHNFVEDVFENRLGEDVRRYMILMFNQTPGHIRLHLYRDYKLYNVVQNLQELEAY